MQCDAQDIPGCSVMLRISCDQYDMLFLSNQVILKLSHMKMCSDPVRLTHGCG